MQLVEALPGTSCDKLKSSSEEQKVCSRPLQESLLIHRLELCKHSDELSQEEKAAELLPIGVQQLYVLQRLGKPDEAQAIASEVKAEE